MDFAKATKTTGKSDLWLTPPEAIYPIIPYIPKNSKIWCPFDTVESEFWKVLSPLFETVITHIDTGNDFFETNVEDCDIIISNFPYSLRQKIFDRLFDLDKPFMMLCNYAGLWDSIHRYEEFKKYGIELLILKGRTKFSNDAYTGGISSPMFQSIYVCHDVLPEKICYQ